MVVTDRGNCPIEKEEDVVVNGEGLKLNVSIEKPSCFGDNDGFINVSQTGGEMPIDYSWSNGSIDTSIENLISGTYTVFAKDAFGCTDGLVIMLPDPEELKAEIINQDNSLFAKVTGGNPSYSYVWSNGAEGTTVISNLEAGDYGLTVEDSKGCIDSAMGEILSPLSTIRPDQVLTYSMYPNLVSDNLRIEMELSQAELITFEVYSVGGSLIKSYACLLYTSDAADE